MAEGREDTVIGRVRTSRTCFGLFCVLFYIIHLFLLYDCCCCRRSRGPRPNGDVTESASELKTPLPSSYRSFAFRTPFAAGRFFGQHQLDMGRVYPGLGRVGSKFFFLLQCVGSGPIDWVRLDGSCSILR